MNIKYLKWKMIGNDGFLLNLAAMPQSMFYHGQLHFGLVTIKVINITPNYKKKKNTNFTHTHIWHLKKV